MHLIINKMVHLHIAKCPMMVFGLVKETDEVKMAPAA